MSSTKPKPASSQWRSTLRLPALLQTALLGLRTRRARTALTAAGIAIGIASMVTVMGISASSKADLLAELDTFGTNMFEVKPASTGFGPEPLPVDAPTMLHRMDGVTASAGAIATNLEVKRNQYAPSFVGIQVLAVDDRFAPTLRASVARGRVFDDGTRSLPVAVAGAAAAERLNLSLDGGPLINIGGNDLVLVGILEPLPLQPDIDRAVMVGDEYAIEAFQLEPNPTRVLVRIEPDEIDATRPLLSRTSNPESPAQVQVSRPSDLLEARAEIDKNLQNLLLGLGSIALLVAALGIANIMVISVLERTGEIGLRRALGARKRHIAFQFLLEAGVLAAIGGIVGVVIGAAITWGYASRQDWLVDVPTTAIAGGLGGALLIGVLAGLYPASKAARLDPAEAVRR